MSYAAHHRDFGSFVSQASKGEGVPKNAGVLRRIFDALMASRQRDADRQITRFLAARSARTLTDDLEREISQRLSTSNWSLNANPVRQQEVPMTIRSAVAMPGIAVDHRARLHATVSLPDAIASRLLQFQSAWTRLWRGAVYVGASRTSTIGFLPTSGSVLRISVLQNANDHCSSRRCDTILVHNPIAPYHR